MDQQEVATLYRKYGVVVYRRLLRLLGRKEEARDGMQEVFVRALRHGRQFRGEAEAGTWLYRITTNLAIDLLRARSRRGDALPLTSGRVDLSAQFPPQSAGNIETHVQVTPQPLADLYEVRVEARAMVRSEEMVVVISTRMWRP